MRHCCTAGVCAIVVTLTLGISTTHAVAQLPSVAPSLARCDSVVGASRVDAVQVGLFVSITRVDGGELTAPQSTPMARVVASGFIAPRPLRLNIFSGSARMRILRSLAADTTPELQPPTITGVYRFTASKRGALSRLQVVRASLTPGFDSASIAALELAAKVKGLVPPDGEDSMRVDVRFSTDSGASALRIVSATFPRMPVVNAKPHRDNPAPEFPDDEKGDSTVTGEVLLRFVVDLTGVPAMETVELMRGRSLSFIKAALAILPKQMFDPATIHGCPVSQRVDYPFTFAAPPSEARR
jgi:hypothetical protein